LQNFGLGWSQNLQKFDFNFMTLISNLEYGDEFVEWTQKCWKIQGSDHFA